MPTGDERSWQEATAAARVRLTTLEKESDRTRETLHQLRSEVQAIRYLAEQVATLAGDVRDLADKVTTVSRHAVNRPTPTGLQVLGQYIGLIVAIVALVIAAGK